MSLLHNLLIVEDDPGLQKQLKWALKDTFSLVFASTREQALSLFIAHQPDVVVHDLGLPPDERGVAEGKASIKTMLKASPRPKIIVMTGRGDEQDAIELINSGAHDFLSKPVEIETLKTIIDRAFYLGRLESQSIKGVLHQSSDGFLLPGVIGQSKVMQEIARQVHKIAKTSATTFIHGESGTGKELIAQAIHQLSPRKDQPFIAINCAAIPENLLESELFGYEKGAFTGANKTTIGKIEQANGGTLFLDEIGDMAYDLQSKILRFLQERTIQRVGGHKETPVDVRVISATHQDLQEMIKSGQFRQDLYYRINEIEITLPALSDREDDIEMIAQFLLEKFSSSHGKGQIQFSEDALEAIKDAQWQGNIRQLSNQINRAVILCEGNVLSSQDLALLDDEKNGVFNKENFENIPTLKEAKDKVEVSLIMQSMKANGNNVSETAKQLNVTRQRIYDLLKKHEISF